MKKFHFLFLVFLIIAPAAQATCLLAPDANHPECTLYGEISSDVYVCINYEKNNGLAEVKNLSGTVSVPGTTPRFRSLTCNLEFGKNTSEKTCGNYKISASVQSTKKQDPIQGYASVLTVSATSSQTSATSICELGFIEEQAVEYTYEYGGVGDCR